MHGLRPEGPAGPTRYASYIRAPAHSFMFIPSFPRATFLPATGCYESESESETGGSFYR